MSIYAGKRLKLRCPKCKGANFELSETYEEAILFTVQDGVMPEKATDHYPGAIIGMGATCNACGHSWTPRAKSIDDIVIDDDAAMSAGAQPAKLDADLLTTIREAAAKKAEGAITKDGRAVFINYGDSEQQMLDGAEMACPHCGGSGHKDDVRPVASPAALTDAVRRLMLATDAVELGRSIHNERKPEDKIEGPVWNELKHASSEVRALLAASPADQVGWQPIETAPRDQEIWAFNGEQARMQWSEGYADNGEGWALWVWCDALLSDADPEPDQPTHWMPIPAAPMSATPPAAEAQFTESRT